jgi:hypothetical protein
MRQVWRGHRCGESGLKFLRLLAGVIHRPEKFVSFLSRQSGHGQARVAGICVLPRIVRIA